MRRLFYALFLLPSLLFAQAAFDVSFQQVNAAGTEFEEKLVNPVASSLAGFNSTRVISNVTLTAADFNLVAGVLSIDYTNGQAASAVNKGFLTSADWSTFNSKLSVAVTSLTGTANRVLANGTSGIAQTGAVTITTPQDTDTAASVQFKRLGLGVSSFSNQNHGIYNESGPTGSGGVFNYRSAGSVTATANGASLYDAAIETSFQGAFTGATAYGIAINNSVGATVIDNYYAIHIDASGIGTTSYAIKTVNAGLVDLGDTTDSTASSNGAVVTAGGIGVAKSIYAGGSISPSASTVTWTAGSGDPETVVTAPVGSLYSRTDGGSATSLYVKESGAGNTGWQPK